MVAILINRKSFGNICKTYYLCSKLGANVPTNKPFVTRRAARRVVGKYILFPAQRGERNFWLYQVWSSLF